MLGSTQGLVQVDPLSGRALLMQVLQHCGVDKVSWIDVFRGNVQLVLSHPLTYLVLRSQRCGLRVRFCVSKLYIKQFHVTWAQRSVKNVVEEVIKLFHLDVGVFFTALLPCCRDFILPRKKLH